jgi:hypothetical protein
MIIEGRALVRFIAGWFSFSLYVNMDCFFANSYTKSQFVVVIAY